MSWSPPCSLHPPASAAALLAVARLIEQREDKTGQHVLRVRDYALAIADAHRCMAMTSSPIDDVFLLHLAAAAPLHDIGKSILPDAILLKPSSLTAEEFEQVKTHTVYGANALAPLASHPDADEAAFYESAICLVRSHHENWDGSGYPDGLRGEAIPLMARIFAVADAFDALTSWRCYRPASTVERAVHVIENAAGRHFDPQVVKAFIQARPLVDSIRRSSAIDPGQPSAHAVGGRP